jgi:integrase
MMKSRSSNMRRRTCTCRCCSRYGLASGRAISCACHGRPDGSTIRLLQSKSIRRGARPVRVVIPAGAPLKAALDAMPKKSPIILLNSDHRPWTPDGFRASWGKACSKAGVTGVTFNDLRGTAVTRLALIGCTEAQIASITGHTLRDVRSILDAHYLHRDPELARTAIHKLEMGYAKRVAASNPSTLVSK